MELSTDDTSAIFELLDIRSSGVWSSEESVYVSAMAKSCG